jgi:GNAT superfamily N-acetyltransferase
MARGEPVPVMLFREAIANDIPQIQIVRHSVKENVLSDPSLVTDKDCEDYLLRRGKGWVCGIGNNIVGFAIADLVDDNIWALFVHPDHEKKGIGRRLHDLMMNWYFGRGKQKAWLSTAPGSRAETFYRKAGWKETGVTKSGETRFELTPAEWIKSEAIH